MGIVRMTPLIFEISIYRIHLPYRGFYFILRNKELAMVMKSNKRVHGILLFFNLILLGITWFMAFYAYPRLPSRMPLWLNFFGQDPILSDKSSFFFIYVLAQTLLVIVLQSMVHIKHRTEKSEKSTQVQSLQKEFILLVSIFFQLIFIHIQRSLILLAHGVEKGIRPYYFYSVFGMILILIPYYRMRLKALQRG